MALARAQAKKPIVIGLTCDATGTFADSGQAGRRGMILAAVIEEIRDEGIAILLVEQNSTLALGIAHRAYVIDDGRIVHSSRAADLEADQALKHRLLAV